MSSDVMRLTLTSRQGAPEVITYAVKLQDGAWYSVEAEGSFDEWTFVGIVLRQPFRRFDRNAELSLSVGSIDISNEQPTSVINIPTGIHTYNKYIDGNCLNTELCPISKVNINNEIRKLNK